MEITLITPTKDRPVAFKLCEHWMGRQSYKGNVQWIVCDDGEKPVQPTMGQLHLRRPSDDRPTVSFIKNLLHGIQQATGHYIFIIEDDDWYPSYYLKHMLSILDTKPVDICGSIWQPYYYLPSQRYRVYRNKGSSLCQTAFNRDLLPLFEDVLLECLSKKSFGVDGTFWARVKQQGIANENFESRLVVGIKGLPGSKGLGVGHRPGAGWKADPNWNQLSEWIGNDVEIYKEFSNVAAKA